MRSRRRRKGEREDRGGGGGGCWIIVGLQAASAPLTWSAQGRHNTSFKRATGFRVEARKWKSRRRRG